MFNKLQKGEYGYLKSYRREKLIISMILAIMIAFIIITMLILFGDTGRVIIVFAILLTLPFAKFFIAWIMCAKFEPLNKDDYNRLINTVYDSETTTDDTLKFDIVVTQYEGMKFFQSLCVKNGKIIALVLSDDKSGDNKINNKEYKAWIENAVSDKKYNYPVTILNNIDAYAKKVKSISTPNDKTAMIDRHILEKIITTCV